MHTRRPQTTIVLDMDSSVSETHGAQEGSAYNGHFGCTCYHPLFLFNQFGDLERCSLRSGNVHSAADWRDVLEPVVARYRNRMKRRYFRGDAAYANPGIYEFLEAEGYKYTIRLPANAVLQERIGWLLKRPAGRPPRDVRRYANFNYQAASWTKARRVVAKVEWHPGELYPRVGFIVTNMSRPPERVTLFYNRRGTAEQHIKEGKNAIVWTRLSCRRFAANAVRLQLHALAYNLANFLRTLTLTNEVSHWSMTTLRDRLVKIGAKVVRHGRSRSKWPRSWSHTTCSSRSSTPSRRCVRRRCHDVEGDTLTGRADYRQETCVPTLAKSTEFASKWRTHHQSGGEQRDHGIGGFDRRWEPRLSFTRNVRIGRAYGKCRTRASMMIWLLVRSDKVGG